MNDMQRAREIMKEIAKKYGFSVYDLKKRKRLYRSAKIEAIKEIRSKTDLTFENIAELFQLKCPSSICKIMKKN